MEVGIRELKAKLSYYVQLAQTGEVIAVKVRNRVVAFLTNIGPEKNREHRSKKWEQKKLQKKIEGWKNEGLLLSGGLCRPHRVEPIALEEQKEK